MTASSSPSLVEIIDYGGGNLGSLLRAFDRLAIPYVRVAGLNPQTGELQLPSGKHPMVLPGVGAFGAIMHQLHARQLVEPVKKLAQAGVPLLGVCVGLQVLFEGSEEAPEVAGFGLLQGQVVRFAETNPETQRSGKVPQIGWNWIEAKQLNWPAGFVYYVNSYYAQAQPEAVLYESVYEGQAFCGAVKQGNLTAFQFHPEKSDTFGHELLKLWWEAL